MMLKCSPGILQRYRAGELTGGQVALVAPVDCQIHVDPGSGRTNKARKSTDYPGIEIARGIDTWVLVVGTTTREEGTGSSHRPKLIREG